jgi:hypothetical protein
MAFSRKMYTNEGLLVAAAAVESQLKPPEANRLPLKRTDTSRVRVGKPLGTILPTGTGQ